MRRGSVRHINDARLEDLRAQRARGKSLRALARAFSYSTEGVRQLLLATGGDPKPGTPHPGQKLIGERRGRLTVVSIGPRGEGQPARVLCRCDCGNEKTIGVGELGARGTRSCGCLCGDWARENRARLITYQGRTQPLQDWCRELGLKRVTLSRRLNTGWSAEDALSTPVYGRYGAKDRAPRRQLCAWAAVGIVAEVLMGFNCRQVSERRCLSKGTVETIWYGRTYRELFKEEAA